MKRKIILSFIAAAMCLAISGCEGNGASSAQNSSQSSQNVQQSSDEQSGEASSLPEKLSMGERTKKVLDEVEFPTMVEVKAKNLQYYYGIDEEDLEEFSAYVCGSGVDPDEFGVFKVKNGKAEDVKALLEKRLSSQKKSFADYNPESITRFDDSFVIIDGEEVVYAVCSDNAAAKEILLN